MKKNTIKIVVFNCTIAVLLLGLICALLPLSFASKVSAQEYVFSYAQEFDSQESLNDFYVSDTQAVSVADGELLIENTSGSTQVKFNQAQISNFALLTRFKVKSGEGAFSLLYNLQEDGKGHELKVNTRQIDIANAYSYYGTYVEMVEQGEGGKATEYRAIRKNLEGEFDSKLYMFNFYEPFEYDTPSQQKEYELHLVVKDNVTNFYCNGVLVLKVPLFESFSGKGIAIKVDGEVSLSFTNFKVLGLGTYAQTLCDGLSFNQQFTTQQKVDFKAKTIKVRNEIDRILSNQQKLSLDNYNKLLDAEQFVKDEFAPKIVLDGQVPVQAKKGDTITLPRASATSFYNESLTVNIVVEFNGKYVKVNSRKATLNESGTYTVKYVCNDSEGNQAIKIFEITV